MELWVGVVWTQHHALNAKMTDRSLTHEELSTAPAIISSHVIFDIKPNRNEKCDALQKTESHRGLFLNDSVRRRLRSDMNLDELETPSTRSGSARGQCFQGTDTLIPLRMFQPTFQQKISENYHFYFSQAVFLFLLSPRLLLERSPASCQTPACLGFHGTPLC